MKKVLVICLLWVSLEGTAQILDPVKWSTKVEKVSDSEYDLIATATIDRGWHLYSQSVPEGGPIATTFTFTGNKNYLKKGNTKEGDGEVVNDKIFEMQIKYFGDKASFKQRIKLRSSEKFDVQAVVEYMACNDTQCTAPKEADLSFSVR